MVHVSLPGQCPGGLGNRAQAYWYLAPGRDFCNIIFPGPYKNFKLYILINFKRKSKYLKIIKLLAFCVPGAG